MDSMQSPPSAQWASPRRLNSVSFTPMSQFNQLHSDVSIQSASLRCLSSISFTSMSQFNQLHSDVSIQSASLRCLSSISFTSMSQFNELHSDVSVRWASLRCLNSISFTPMSQFNQLHSDASIQSAPSTPHQAATNNNNTTAIERLQTHRTVPSTANAWICAAGVNTPPLQPPLKSALISHSLHVFGSGNSSDRHIDPSYGWRFQKRLIAVMIMRSA